MKVVPKNQSTFIAIRLKRDISGSRGDYLIVNEAAENVDIVSNAVFFENFAVEAASEPLVYATPYASGAPPIPFSSNRSSKTTKGKSRTSRRQLRAPAPSISFGKGWSG